MKNGIQIYRVIISVFVLMCLLLPVNNAWSAEGNLKKVTLKVDGMSCACCAAPVKAALESLP